ncbi:hypothetical protein D3C77_682740 [compost metagenome]
MFVPLVVSVRILRFLGLFLVTISIIEALQWASGQGKINDRGTPVPKLLLEPYADLCSFSEFLAQPEMYLMKFLEGE